MVLQVTDERRDTAKGVELLLSATVLEQYFSDEGDAINTEALEVRPCCSILMRV